MQVRKLRLQQEVEKSRVLEDALHILAEQHNQLEQSLGGHRSPTAMFDLDDDDEFFDCADDEGMEWSSDVFCTRIRTEHFWKGMNFVNVA